MPTRARARARATCHEQRPMPVIEFGFGGPRVPAILSANERSGPATMWQDDGSLGWGPMNIILQSQSFGVTWFPVNASVSSNVVSAPDGTVTADLILEDGSTNAHGVDNTFGVVVPGRVTVSIDLKYAGRQWVRIDPYGAASPGTDAVWFDILNGVKGAESANAIGSILSLGDGWYRLVWSATAAAPANLVYSVRGAVADNSTANYAGLNGPAFYAWGAQANYGESLQPYLPTTTAARYLLRNELSPFTGRRGLLMEGQRTNLVANSQATAAAWGDVNITFTAASATGPDGTTSATKIESTAAAATTLYIATSQGAAGTALTFSAIVKKGSGAAEGNRFACYNASTSTLLFYGTLNYDTLAWTAGGGAGSALVEDLGSGWVRLRLTVTAGIAATQLMRFYVGFDGGAEPAGEYFYHYHSQVEDGEMASSPIYTSGAVASRTADACTYTLPAALATALSAAGTMLVEFDYAGAGSAASSNRYSARLDDGGSNERIQIYNVPGDNVSALVNDGGVGQYYQTTGSLSVNTESTAAVAWIVDSCRAARDGALAGADVAPSTMPTIDRLGIGCRNGFAGSEVFGHIYRIRIWDHRLTDAELQAVT